MIIFQFLTIRFTSFVRQIFRLYRQFQATAASGSHATMFTFFANQLEKHRANSGKSEPALAGTVYRLVPS
jgi:hypothetical protein